MNNPIANTQNAFHGNTLGALAVTGSPKYQQPFRSLLAEHPVVPFNDEAALERLVERSLELLGHVDFLINNAGISGAEEMSGFVRKPGVSGAGLSGPAAPGRPARPGPS